MSDSIFSKMSPFEDSEATTRVNPFSEPVEVEDAEWTEGLEVDPKILAAIVKLTRTPGQQMAGDIITGLIRTALLAGSVHMSSVAKETASLELSNDDLDELAKHLEVGPVYSGYVGIVLQCLRTDDFPHVKDAIKFTRAVCAINAAVECLPVQFRDRCTAILTLLRESMAAESSGNHSSRPQLTKTESPQTARTASTAVESVPSIVVPAHIVPSTPAPLQKKPGRPRKRPRGEVNMDDSTVRSEERYSLRPAKDGVEHLAKQ